MNTDVVIVGAGPVGLMLGCELARRGVSHAVVESQNERLRYCKALGVTARTLELLDYLGALDEALRRGLHFSAMNIVAHGETVQRMITQHDALPYGAFGLAQPDMEDILEDVHRQFGGRLHRNMTLAQLEQDDHGVNLQFEDGQTWRARYLVGCDGAHSRVRKILGIDFPGQRYDRTFVLGDVHIAWDRPHQECWQFLLFEDGEMRNNITVIPNPTGPGRYRVSTSVDPEHPCSERPTLDDLTALVAPALPTGTVLSDLRWSSRYNISHRHAERYQQGRVFLAGDAAHIHPPIGGLGMNTGLQDAHNLGWKLAGVCQGWLQDSVLETYHSERHPVGAKVVEVTAARMDRSMSGKISRDQSESPLFDTQLTVRYEPGPLVGGQAPDSGKFPRPGDRLPTVLGLRRPHVAGEVRLAELFRRPAFHLFTHDTDHDAFHQKAHLWLPEPLRCWAILEQEPSEAMGYFCDPDGHWRHTVGPGAVFVRPDGVIGWRGQDPESFAQWLGRLPLRTAR